MKEVPFTNDKKHIVYVGSKSIPPGETRMVDESMLFDAHGKDNGVNVDQPPMGDDPLLSLLDQSISEVVDALPSLSDQDIDQLESAENNGKTRKGILEAIAKERLRRAGDPS